MRQSGGRRIRDASVAPGAGSPRSILPTPTPPGTRRKAVPAVRVRNSQSNARENDRSPIAWVAMNRAGSENPLGLGLVIVGAVAMAIAAFLPLDEPTGVFATVRDNTLIQHGGWLLIGFALAIAVSGFRVSQGRRTERWVPIILCAVAAALVVITANEKDLRTLYPIGPDGNPVTSQPGMVANLGVAIYVAGAGVAVAFIASLILRQSVQRRVEDDPLIAAWDAPGSAEPATKKCPDCAETILADAKVCKHCGYRFAPAGNWG
jgi:hypothetical protein